MKNTIIIDAKNSCTCDLVSSVDDGTNRIILSIISDLTLNPVLVIGSDSIIITDTNFEYEIPSSKLIAGSAFQFYIKDDKHTGDTFTVTIPDDTSGNWILKQNSNFAYTLSAYAEVDLLAEIIKLSNEIKSLSDEIKSVNDGMKSLSDKANNLSNDLKSLSDDLSYEPGDTEEFSFYGGAILSNANKGIYFTAPVKDMSKISTVTMSGASIIVRQNGSYLVGSASEASSSGFTISISKVNAHTIMVTVTFSSSIGGTNNDAVGLRILGTLKFS